MRPIPTRAAIAALAATAALACLGPLPARASTAPTPSPLSADVRGALMRDLHLSQAGLDRRVAQEAEAARTATALRARIGDRLAGLWFDAGDGRLHSAVSTDADASAARSAGAVAHHVQHSRHALDAAQRSLSAHAGSTPGVLSWGPDVRNNRLEVTVDPDRVTATTSAFLRTLTAFGDLVHVTESRDTPRQQGGSIVGGEKWIPGTESPCSIGFPVTRTSGNTKAFLTAGHCTNDADQPAYGKDGTRVGTSNRNGTGSVNAREGDMGIVDVDQAGWDVSGTVSGWGKGDIAVSGSADAVVGTAICRSGQTTGLQCGEVTKVDQSVDYGNVVIDGLSYTSACSAGGDSGGSYVTAAGGKAVGLHSGGGSATCTSGSGEKFTIFQPVNEALARFGARLVTSAPQPGGVTVAAVSDQNTTLGTAVEVHNSAEGGTAPYTFTATGLPAGLTINGATGTITGTPTTAGTSTVTVTATDSAGAKGGTSFAWTVTRASGTSPVLADPGSQNLRTGRPVNLPLAATGGTTPYTFTATGLPAGLTINRATGTITGTPTAWGFRNAVLTVTDAAGRTASVTVTFTVWS
ncbi:putative Ig domain-containing protein [Streptomyces sp. NPDC048111]|uniref:putative Ig domain-containing protein n=1 Tax=Streptomyces sp. NPDC048111 TaxID=3365500 RepID=UPI003710B24E